MPRTLLALLLACGVCHAGPQLSINNGAWVYDAIYDKYGHIINFQPGLYVNEIDKYNVQALSGRKVTQVFSYGGSIEMYCKGSGESDPATACNPSNVFVYYDAGRESTTAYYNAGMAADNRYDVVPIIDGVIGSDTLLTFNTMDVVTANIVADKVAATMCADDRIPGVQFDLEPFDMAQKGQLLFFRRIAKDFAGQNKPGSADPLKCVNAKFPEGRFFSVFSFASHATQRVANVFNKFSNGYFIDSLYDLAPTPVGIVTPLAQYNDLVNEEITSMYNKAKKYNLKYQFGIPASATAHEFEVVDETSTGIHQVDYNRIVMKAILADKLLDDVLFLGVNMYGYKYASWVQGHSFLPTIPDPATTLYLSENL